MAPRQQPKYCEPEPKDYSCHFPKKVEPPALPGDKVLTKVCTVIPNPEPSVPTPCQIQRKEQKLKAGVTFCPKPPPLPPPLPPPPCLGICIEKVKNPHIPIKKFDDEIVCVVEKVPTTQDRCEKILAAEALDPDIPFPGCAKHPLPPPPEENLCEVLARKKRIEDCKERMKRYLE